MKGKIKKSSIKPLEVTSRYGNFNEYLATRFRDLNSNNNNKKEDPCLCATCERYCNTLSEDDCQNEKKCNWDKNQNPKCKTIKSTYFCDCDKKYEKLEKSDLMMLNQKFITQYAEIHNVTNKPDSKGLLIYHGLGSGKTCSGIYLANVSRTYYENKTEYKRKVIIMIPANLNLDPWIKELKGKCNLNRKLKTDLNKAYKKYKSKSDKEQIRQYKKICKEHDIYLVHYNADSVKGGWREDLMNIPNRRADYFKNNYSNNYSDDDYKRTNPFDDCVLVIDEVHNLSNNFAKDYAIESQKKSSKVRLIYNQFMESKNSKVFLLTGTPIINNPFEVIFLLNMVRGGDIKFGKRQIKFTEDIDKFEKRFFKQKDDKIMIKNEKLFKTRINGLVSYYAGINKEVFADKVFKQFTIPMDGRFRAIYNSCYKLEISISLDVRENSDDNFSSKIFSQQASNFCYPAWIFSINEQRKMKLTKNGKKIGLIKIAPHVMKLKGKKYIFDGIPSGNQRDEALTLLDNDSKPLHIDNDLRELSPKMYVIIKKIQQSNGPVLVYSKFKGGFGVSVFTLALEQNGFSNYNKNKRGNDLKYMTWTPETRKEESRKRFNAEDNKDGSKIKVFVMTEAGKEGINLLGVRQVHILEPWYHTVVDRQVIGRAVRICSHAHIPKNTFKDFTGKKPVSVNNWLVNVFNYMTVTRKKNGKVDLNKSVDWKMHLTGKAKREKENAITNLLKEQSIDCRLHNKDSLWRKDSECDTSEKFYDNFMFWDIEDDEDIKGSLQQKKYKGQNLYILGETVLKKTGDNSFYKIGNYINNKIVISNSFFIPNELTRKSIIGDKEQQEHFITDYQGSYSLTYKNELTKMIKIIKNDLGKSIKNQIAVDFTLGTGSDTIELSKNFKKVYSFEIDTNRCTMAKYNVYRIFKRNNVDIKCSSSIDIIKNMKKWLKYIDEKKVHFTYIDFPWGGKDYKKKKSIETLYLDSYSWNYLTDEIQIHPGKKLDVYQFIDKVLPYSENIGLKLPYNFNIKKLIETYPKLKVNVSNISKSIIFIIINNS